MDAMEALANRRSVRRYKSDPVPKKLIEAVADAGRLAATANNGQPWEFVAVSDAAQRRKLAEICEYGKFIADAPVCIVVLSKDTKYYLEDCSAAIQNMLVAAHAQGLGTCWVAGDKKPYADKIRELVGAPAGFKHVACIALGYPTEKPEKKKRGLNEVLHWEKF